MENLHLCANVIELASLSCCCLTLLSPLIFPVPRQLGYIRYFSLFSLFRHALCLLFWHCKWKIYAKFIRWMVYKYYIACMPSDKRHHEPTNQPTKKKTHTSLHFASHNTLARNIIHLRLNRTNTQKAAKNLLKW